MTYRLDVTLDDERAAKLRRLAEQESVDENTLACSLLSSVLDESDSEDQDMADLLDRIPGAWESAQQGLAEARAGLGTELDDL